MKRYKEKTLTLNRERFTVKKEIVLGHIISIWN